MEVWTEVLAEDVSDVHVGTRDVIVPLGDDVSERRARQVTDNLLARRAYREWSDNLRKEVQRQQRVRERLEGTEYEGML